MNLRHWENDFRLNDFHWFPGSTNNAFSMPERRGMCCAVLSRRRGSSQNCWSEPGLFFSHVSYINNKNKSAASRRRKHDNNLGQGERRVKRRTMKINESNEKSRVFFLYVLCWAVVVMKIYFVTWETSSLFFNFFFLLHKRFSFIFFISTVCIAWMRTCRLNCCEHSTYTSNLLFFLILLFYLMWKLLRFLASEVLACAVFLPFNLEGDYLSWKFYFLLRNVAKQDSNGNRCWIFSYHSRLINKFSLFPSFTAFDAISVGTLNEMMWAKS